MSTATVVEEQAPLQDDIQAIEYFKTAHASLKAEIANRVKDGIASTHGQVYIWDVVNEAGAETELWERTGWDYFPEVYRLARAADPSIQLAYNDYNIANEAPDGGLLRHKVEDRIQRLLDAGAPVDVLGDQAHMGIPLTPIPRVLEIWDDWGQRFKKPLEITEFDASIPDDTVHEKYVRDFVTAAFSDPNVQSFVMWGFWEKAQYAGAAGCLFRADWSPRPAEVTFENLVLNQWRTNLTLTTDAAGNATTRAFLGDYDVQVSANGETQTVKLTVTAAGTQETIRLP